MSLPPLLAATADLLGALLTHTQAADAAIARFFDDRRPLPRTRAALADAAFAVLRRKPLFEQLCTPPFCSALADWPLPRRLALLALAHTGALADCASALPAEAARWLAASLPLLAGQAVLPATFSPACHHHLPAWLAATLQAQKALAGDGFDQLAQALVQPAPLDVRVNLLKAKRPQALAALGEAGIEASATPHSPWGLRLPGKPRLHALPAWQNGWLEVQDEGSQLLALLTQARRGELVVDFCAGAGGKTLALGAMMRGTGRLYAFDTSAHRLQGLQPRLRKSGLGNVHTAAIAHERDARLHALRGKADCVLVDAPCSGLGTLRRAPDLKWRVQAADLPALAQRQIAIAQAAAALVKPGGRLIYATCSLLTEENEAVARQLDALLPGYTPLPAGPILAAAKVPQAPGLFTPAGHLRLWPHLHGTDGFFAALWQRR